MILTAESSNPNCLVQDIKRVMAELGVVMPPTVEYADSDEIANQIAKSYRKNDDEHKKTPITYASGNFCDHAIHLLVIGPDRGLKFTISSNMKTIFVHISNEDC